MAKSDIILNDNNVEVKGALKVSDTSTSSAATVLITSGAVIAKRLLSESANIKDIYSNQVMLGAIGNNEPSGKNGKITMLNAQGKIVLTIEAKNVPKISVAGFGDLISELAILKIKVKQLELKVKQLERRNP